LSMVGEVIVSASVVRSASVLQFFPNLSI